MDKRPNFKEIEEKWKKKWKELKLYKFNSKKIFDGKNYIIDSPPPFPSGTVHAGNVFGFIRMDFIARYYKLKGYNVYYPRGWDVHGLPIELKIEKKYGKLNKDEFLEKCKELVNYNIQLFRDVLDDLGILQDIDLEYKTMDNLYKKLTQYTLIEMYERGLLYREYHPVYYCPNCKTAISAQEVGYKKEKGIMAYILLEAGEYKILIATTRPELINSCSLVLFGEGKYVITKNNIIVSKKFAEENNLEIIKEVDTKFLENLKVKIPLINREVKLLKDEDVEYEFGTGFVWVCTYGDEQDIVWQKRYNLPVIKSINEEGKIVNSLIKEIEGLSVKKAREKIIEILKEKGYIFDVKEIEHNVLAHVERSDCQKPVELIPSYQWFFKVKEFKEILLKEQEKIKFIPEEFRKRLIDWINSIKWDWIISRQRFWGVPFPFWICDGKIIPADRDKLPIDPTKEIPEELKKKCKEVKPVEDVLDCWVESSITNIAILVYALIKDLNYDFEKAYEKAKELLPTTIRFQGYEIIRTWLFNTLYRSIILANKIPWKEVLINGMVLDSKGRKMSKSLGNVVYPKEYIEKYSADAFRYWAMLSTNGYDYRVLEKEFKAGNMFAIKLWNIGRFLYLRGIKIGNKPRYKIDIWILEELKKLYKDVDNLMKEYNLLEIMKKIRRFVWDIFSNIYLELGKVREDEEFLEISNYVFRKILIILHPAMPFITEELYNRLYYQIDKKESILYNTIKIEDYDEEYIKYGENLIKIIEYIKELKTKKGLKIREPIDEIELEKVNLDEETLDLVKKYFNIGKIKWSKN